MAFLVRIDLALLQAINGYAGHWPVFDQIIKFVANFAYLKGGVYIAMLWGLWFTSRDNRAEMRARTLHVILGAGMVAVSVPAYLILKSRRGPATKTT